MVTSDTECGRHTRTGTLASVCAFLLLSLLTLQSPAYAADWDRYNLLWETTGPVGETVVRAMAVFSGNLYVGTEVPGGTAQVWRFNGAAWTNVSPAWPASNTAVGAMVVYENLMFVGTENAAAGAQMWQMTAAEVWAQEAPGWPAPQNWSVSSVALYDSCLYVGLANAGGCGLYRRNAGGAWNAVNINGSFTDVNNTSITAMYIIWGWLYAGTRNANNGAKLWRVGAGLAPGLTNQTGPWGATTDAVSSLCAFNGYLYIGTERPAVDGGAQIWETPNCVGWLNVVNNGFGNVDNDRISAMHVAGVRMYAGTRNLAGGESCCLYATTDALNWFLEDDDPGLDNPNNNDIRSFATYSSRVYCGTSNPAGSEVYRTDVVTWGWSGGGGGGGGGGICLVADVCSGDTGRLPSQRLTTLLRTRERNAAGIVPAFGAVFALLLMAAAVRRSAAGKVVCLLALLACAGCATGPAVQPPPSAVQEESVLRDVPPEYRERVKTTLAAAGDAKSELLRVLQDATGRQMKWAAFLVANLPPRDLGMVSADLLLDHLKNAELACGLFHWAETVPEDVFLHYVLPYRVSQESLAKWRGYFISQLHPRVKDLASMEEVAQEVNRWTGENVTFKPTEFRDQGPFETLRTGYGRCEEMMIVYVAAARSVGIPARCVSTPWWATCDNNHAWVEVWTGGRWRYLGACEPAATLDDAWFRSPARRAAVVYSACFGVPETDEIVYRRGTDFTYMNTTPVYSETCAVDVAVSDAAGAPRKDVPVVISVFNYGGLRPVARKTTDEQGRAQFVLGIGQFFLSAGTTESERAWKVIDTSAGKEAAPAAGGQVVCRRRLEESLRLGQQPSPDGVLWLRYPKPE